MKPDEPQKTKFRRFKKKKRVIDRFANWLQTSSSKTVLVAALTSIAFLAGLSSAVWTAYKEYMRSKAVVVLRITSVETGARVYTLNMRQFAGLPGPADKDDPLSQMEGEVPTFNVAFDILNPTDQRVAIIDCALKISHKGLKGSEQSGGSMTLNAILNKQVEGPNPIVIEANSAAHVERIFLFSQINTKKYLNTDLNDKREFSLFCFDQNRQSFKTSWSTVF